VKIVQNKEEMTWDLGRWQIWNYSSAVNCLIRQKLERMTIYKGYERTTKIVQNYIDFCDFSGFIFDKSKIKKSIV